MKSVEIKTNAEVSFTIILSVHWVKFLLCVAQDDKDRKGLKMGNDFELRRDIYIPKIPKILILIAFPGRILLIPLFGL